MSTVTPPEEITVLIPAAGRVPEGLLALSNIACPAMIPVAGRPVIHWTLSYLRSLGLRRFRIAVARRGMFVEEFVDCGFGADCQVEFEVPSRDGGVGLTVKELAEGVTTRAVLVVLGDTHFHFDGAALLGGDAPFVLVHPVEDSYRWCVVEIGEDGTVAQLQDKEPGLPGPLQALIGVYYFPDATQLRQAARDAVMEAERTGRRAELAGILERVRATTPIRAVPARDWLDCGNPDRQASSHQALLQAREFNELLIDPVLGTITKRSRNVEKFIDEINYFRLLPPDLAMLFPRVLEYSTDWNDPWLRSEYYGYPTLAEVFLFEHVDPGIWERVFTHLREILARFMRQARPLPEGALREMYLGKTRRRLQAMGAKPELAGLVQHEGQVTLNGRRVTNLPLLWSRIEAEVEQLEVSGRGCVVHGDLCLSNVLYDLRSRICKLIDPRGSFATPGLYGDPRYDVAKLYHSVYGLYDFIVNDLFRVTIDGSNDDTRLDLIIRASPAHSKVAERFARVFFPWFDRREVLLITGLLFASMPALHYDRPQRQLAMYARALDLLDEYFSS